MRIIISVIAMLFLVSSGRVTTTVDTCPSLHVNNRFNDKWTDDDMVNIQRLAHRCIEKYGMKSCLLTFIKTGDRTYYVECTNTTNK